MNKVILIGRLVRDPDINEKYARYTLAVDRQTRKEGQQEADFINCIVFGKSIDFVEKYLSKGMKIAIEGRIQTGSYEKDGVKHYTTDIIVDRHEFCESRSSSSGSAQVERHDVNELSQYPEVSFTETDASEDGDLPF